MVSEARLYALWKPPGHNGEGVGMDTGIVAAKLLLNNLHKQLANDGYTQVSRSPSLGRGGGGGGGGGGQ